MTVTSATPFTANSQQRITGVVNRVVAEAGFDSAIQGLLITVRHYAALSIAYPSNGEIEREYKRWAKAVKQVCNRPPQTFEQRVGKADEIMVRGLGVRLD